jgi:Arc/MetJ-type ribon-helix-helix transcriptional regulator
MSTTTFSAQVEEDSELVDQFEEYRESNSMTSKSEAVRTLIREGLEDEQNSQDPQSASKSEPATGTESATRTTDDRPDFAVDSLVLIALAYWVGSVGLPASITATIATPGGLLFTVAGIVILIPLFDRLIKQVDWLIGQASSWLSNQVRTAMLQIRGTN